MTRPTVVLLSDWLDQTAAAVGDALSERGIRHLRLDPYATGGLVRAYFDGNWRGEVCAGSVTLPIEEITAVFLHQLDPIAPGTPQKQFDQQQLRAGLEGILESRAGRWMNHPAAVAGHTKARQLAIAASCGFRTVRAMLANDSRPADDFAVRIGKTYAESVIRREVGLVLPARVYVREHVTTEVTATVFAVGASIFCVSQSNGAYVALDDVPEQVETSTRHYLMMSGLSFCALHFAVTPSGWVFTDADPSEPWNAYATDLGLPIAETIADVLTQD